MGWNRQQNPSGVRNPAIRPIVDDPLNMTTTVKDAREVTRRKARGRRIPAPGGAPIAANSRKAEGFAPKATSAGQ